MCEIIGWINGIICDDITCVALELASLAVMDDIPCDGLTYDDINPEYVRLWDGWMI